MDARCLGVGCFRSVVERLLLVSVHDLLLLDVRSVDRDQWRAT